MSVFKFESSVHTALWGTEDWVISAHASDPSVIADGPQQGRTLRDLQPDFPLLFKVIDAKSRLSVQVHPNETTRLVTGGDPKSEMWCALSDGPIYAGLRPGTTAAEIEAAVSSGRFEELMIRHEARFGEVFYIPGGLVHAIGDGVRLYEVQQSSDTTFRLYDWNRVGKDGKPRELHVERGLKAIDYALGVPTPQATLATPFFRFVQKPIDGTETLSVPAGEQLAIFAARGSVMVDEVALAEGGSALISPASSVTLSAVAPAHVFLTRF